MKKYRLQLLIGITIIGFFTNCEKVKEEEKNVDFLLSKTWKLALVDKNESTNPAGKIRYEAITDCQKDDTYKFNVDGTFIINKGAEKCEVSELPIEINTYNSAKKEMLIKGVKYILAEESENQVKYYTPLSPFSGYDYAVVLLQ